MITLMLKRKRIVVLVGIIFLSSMAFAEAPWNVVKKSSGITVLSRPVDGFALNQFKGQCVIPASLQVIEGIMKDFPAYSRWFAMSRKVSVIKANSVNDYILYYVIDSPWPVSDRDVTVRIRMQFDHAMGKGKVMLKSMTYNYPKEDRSFVRISDMEGSFYFRRVNSELTSVTLIMQVDPLLQFSRSYVNKFLIDYPFDTLRNLQKRASKKSHTAGTVSSR